MLSKNGVITWHEHALLDARGIFPRPLGDLLVHLGDFCRIHRPQAAFPLVPVCRRLLDLLETLVQAQVVPDRVFPARGSRLEVGKVLAEIKYKI